MEVFTNLTHEQVQAMLAVLIAKGYSEDDAFTEIYSVECNMDDEDEQ